MIQGRYTRTFHAYAASRFVLDRSLNDTALEIRLEVLWCGREHLQNAPEPICAVSDGHFISRAYRITANDKPVALINEKFPVVPDNWPS